ncbi:MAG: AAA family ATPase [Pirellulales bacterium]
MSVGLVLGKFAPLHRGHHLLIETALAETDRTVVLIYDAPEVRTPPLQVRSKWIRELYSMVQVIEAWDGPTQTGLDPEITKLHDDYLQRRVGHLGITHFFSSEPYGWHVSLALGATDCRVDQGRRVVPISATEIREASFKHRQFIHPRVYRDLITKVVFLGAPSTGKTTIANELARRYQTVWMPEYGREYWEQHQTQRRLSLEQLVEIAREHRRREDLLVENSNEVLLVDTDATTTLQFSQYYHDTALPELERLADETSNRYDLCFLCQTDIPYDDTWDRSGDVNRQQMQRRIESDLISRKRQYQPLAGSIEQRCQQVIKSIKDFQFRYFGG